MDKFFTEFWPHLTIFAIAAAALQLIAVGHAVLFKRDSRATIGWVGLIVVAPLGIGALVYWMFGINRIHRRAKLLRVSQAAAERAQSQYLACDDEIEQVVESHGRHLVRLAHLVEHVTERPLLQGNDIEMLINGDQAYPAMLQAIAEAKQSIALASYIFDNDSAGQEFVEALSAAHQRGVEIRVLIDSVGARYTIPTIVKPLRRANIRTETFMPSLAPGYFAYFNLRSHRKIMVVDGTIGFTGGMNIREGCLLAKNPKAPTQDVHFRLRGPVVAQLQEVFAEDWAFTTGEVLGGAFWYPPQEAVGPLLARGISYGPDEDLGKMRLSLIGVLGMAQHRVSIVTPYFLPDDALIAALNVAAMRGVEVDILLPEKGNLATVQWACNAMLWQVLERGCKVWLTPPPFDHTKLMVVDDRWSLIGSGNWDARSLRLNFEFNVEVYGKQFAHQISQHIEAKRKVSQLLTLADVDGRALPVRLRDGVAKLFSPYL